MGGAVRDSRFVPPDAGVDLDAGAAAHGGEGRPNEVGISADPSGRYLLFSYLGDGGLYTG